MNLVDVLRRKKAWLCTVESCTGGHVANRITDAPGASEVYFGSWIVYDNRAKELLGVPGEILLKNGAVSKEVAIALAERGLQIMQKALGSKAESRLLLSVSTTGIAGPTGGTPDKPVGRCWLALASPGKPTITVVTDPRPGLDRLGNKKHFSDEAMELILQGCNSNS